MCQSILLDNNSYTIGNVLWCKPGMDHFKKACNEGSLSCYSVTHIIMGVVEIIPVIGHIISLFELFIITYCKPSEESYENLVRSGTFDDKTGVLSGNQVGSQEVVRILPNTIRELIGQYVSGFDDILWQNVNYAVALKIKKIILSQKHGAKLQFCFSERGGALHLSEMQLYPGLKFHSLKFELIKIFKNAQTLQNLTLSVAPSDIQAGILQCITHSTSLSSLSLRIYRPVVESVNFDKLLEIKTLRKFQLTLVDFPRALGDVLNSLIDRNPQLLEKISLTITNIAETDQLMSLLQFDGHIPIEIRRIEFKPDMLETLLKFKSATILGLTQVAVNILSSELFKELVNKHQPLLFFEAFKTNNDLLLLKGLHFLKHLSLKGQPIGDEGLANLVDSVNSIEFLDLTFTRVTDDGMQHLLELKNLTELTLKQTDITEKGLEVLLRHPNLETIEIELREGYITEAGVRELNQRLILCQIEIL